MCSPVGGRGNRRQGWSGGKETWQEERLVPSVGGEGCAMGIVKDEGTGTGTQCGLHERSRMGGSLREKGLLTAGS